MFSCSFAPQMTIISMISTPPEVEILGGRGGWRGQDLP